VPEAHVRTLAMADYRLIAVFAFAAVAVGIITYALITGDIGMPF